MGDAVRKEDYDELVPEELRLTLGKYHYTWAVRIVIGLVEEWRVSQGIKEPIEYIFDRMAERPSKHEIDSVFEQAADMNDSLHNFGIYKGCHSFRDKTEFLPLQAADMLAWSIYQRALHHDSGKPVHQVARETYDYFYTRGLAAGSPTRTQLEDWLESEHEYRRQGVKSVIVKTDLRTAPQK